MGSNKAVKSPQANEERTFHVHMLVESLWILQKIHSIIVFSFKLVFKLFLIFHQISGTCAYKIVLMKKCNVLNHSTFHTFSFQKWYS